MAFQGNYCQSSQISQNWLRNEATIICDENKEKLIFLVSLEYVLNTNDQLIALKMRFLSHTLVAEKHFNPSILFCSAYTAKPRFKLPSMYDL